MPEVARNLVPNGYFCAATPSEAYAPGYVYRIDPTGAELLVDDFRAEARTFAFRAALGSYDARISRGAGLKLALLEPVGSASGSLNVGASGTQESRVSFGDGRFVLMNDAGISALIERATAGIEPQFGSRYFVVRDAIQASSIDIRISSQDEAKLGGETAVARLFTASPNLSVRRQQTLVINGTFDPPLNVCIRAVEMAPLGADDGSGEQPVAEVARWQITTRSASSAEAALILNQ